MRWRLQGGSHTQGIMIILEGEPGEMPIETNTARNNGGGDNASGSNRGVGWRARVKTRLGNNHNQIGPNKQSRKEELRATKDERKHEGKFP